MHRVERHSRAKAGVRMPKMGAEPTGQSLKVCYGLTLQTPLYINGLMIFILFSMPLSR